MSKTSKEVSLYYVHLNSGDWFGVFARGTTEAVRIVRQNHYEGMTVAGFLKAYRPTTTKVAANTLIAVTSVEARRKTRTRKRARDWAKGQRPGLFISNTYDPD